MVFSQTEGEVMESTLCSDNVVVGEHARQI